MSHLDFYSDIGNILSKIQLETVNVSVRELCELRDHVNICEIITHNMTHVLLDQLCIE